MDDQPDVAQPTVEAGQGDTGQQDSPYQQYLEQIPPEAHEAATQAFKQWDGDVTRRFQEASEFRKSWEPYEQAGVNQYSPEVLQWAVNVLQNPQEARQWLDQQYGPVQPEPQPQEFQYDQYQDPQAQFEALLEQKLGPLQQRLEQYDSRWQQQEEQQKLAEAENFLEGQLDELEQKHGADFNRDMVKTLADKYADDPLNAIPKAWDEWQKTVAAIQKQTLQPKVDAPTPAEGGGVPDVREEQPSSLHDPRLHQMAAQIMRNNRSA